MWKPCRFFAHWNVAQKPQKSGKTLTFGLDMSIENSVTRTERFIISSALGGGQCDKNRFKGDSGLQITELFHSFAQFLSRRKQQLSSQGLACVRACVDVCAYDGPDAYLCFCAPPMCTRPLLRWSLFTGNVRGASRLAAWCRVTWRL